MALVVKITLGVLGAAALGAVAWVVHEVRSTMRLMKETLRPADDIGAGVF